jgi:uncharacterized protein (TIGR02301 family)
MRLLLVPLCLCLLATGPGLAQKPRDRSPEAIAEELDLGRTLPFLAYTLGELHYLAYTCEGPEAQQWRQHMIELLAMEAADDTRLRDRLTNSFNDGYRAQQRYRASCGPEANAERRALAHRGRDLSEMMRSAYFD